MHHLELNGFFEAKIKNGFLVKTQPRFEKEALDIDLTQKLSSWILINGILEPQPEGKNINLITCIRVIPPVTTADTQKGTTMKQPLTLTATAIMVATNLIAGETQTGFRLQEAINNASPGDTITIPPGTYTQPVTIRKALTLDGQGAVFEVQANQPAIQIDTSRPVSLKNLEIQYQPKSKQQKGDSPYAVYTSGGDLLIENCAFKDMSRSGNSPCAVLAAEKSTLNIKNSRFEGFDYTIQFWNESSGNVDNCLIANPGHCGITIGEYSSAILKYNIITGSHYHAVRCTGGKIIANANLIMDNKNRGFYIGNKSSAGTLSNNLMINNSIGISVFANSNMKIENNIILRSGYAGLSLSDTATLDMKDNMIINNERGVTGFSEEKDKEPSVKVTGKNLIYGNTVECEKAELSSRTIRIDPLLNDADSGLFAATADGAKDAGLSDPSELQMLWKKWKAATSR